MSDGMEDMMDDETREALAMSKDELLALAAEGKSARVSRSVPRRLRGRRDLNQSAAGIVGEVVAKTEAGAVAIGWNLSSVVFSDAHFTTEGPVAIRSTSVTIRR